MGAYLAVPVTAKERFEGQGPLKNQDESIMVVYGGAAMQGWRRTMEDAHIAQTGLGHGTGAMFGVFDGHGGAEVAKFCQRYMATELQKLESFGGEAVEEALVDVFHRMDDMLRDHSFADEIEQLKTREPGDDDGPGGGGDEDGGPPMDALEMIKRVFQLKRFVGDGGGSGAGGGGEGGEGGGGAGGGGAGGSGAGGSAAGAGAPADMRIQAGCTAVVAVVKAGNLYVANAGDSRGVLCRGGAAVAMSEDHKPAHESERRRILNAGGFLSEIGGVCRVNGNLNLSRAIGDLKYKTNQTLEAKDQIITAEPDVRKVALQPEDEFFLLACDGVWDVMTNQEAVDFVRARLSDGAAPTDAACQLLDACLASDPKESRGVGCDNMTAIVVLLQRGAAGAGGESGGGAGAGAAAPEGEGGAQGGGEDAAG
ncbi:MAG: phosphatase 2C-like domain-containing protein [Monoraphidium minutum]|nr:MAG: phosphatase 2C-like domain-containing protein [Monoraphidium minutum]